MCPNENSWWMLYQKGVTDKKIEINFKAFQNYVFYFITRNSSSHPVETHTSK